MKVGDQAVATAHFGRSDVEAYVALGGAEPPRGVLPEPLIGAVFSRLLGTRLPGPGANYLKQETRYLSPARLDERLSFEVELTRIRPDKSLVDLRTACTGDDGRTVAEGRALIYVGDPGPGATSKTELHEETCP